MYTLYTGQQLFKSFHWVVYSFLIGTSFVMCDGRRRARRRKPAEFEYHLLIVPSMLGRRNQVTVILLFFYLEESQDAMLYTCPHYRWRLFNGCCLALNPLLTSCARHPRCPGPHFVPWTWHHLWWLWILFSMLFLGNFLGNFFMDSSQDFASACNGGVSYVCRNAAPSWLPAFWLGLHFVQSSNYLYSIMPPHGDAKMHIP